MRYPSGVHPIHGYRVQAKLVCDAGCDSPSGFVSDDKVGDDPSLSLESSVHSRTISANIGPRSSGSGGTTLQVGTHLRLTITELPGRTKSYSIANSPFIRCDNLLKINAGYGCVYPRVFPVMKVNYAATDKPVKESAQVILNGQHRVSTSPGARSGLPLKRLWNRKAMSKNYRQARKQCAAHDTRAIGEQCDEYPFKSTREGCYWGAGGDYTKLGSVCAAEYVNGTHNQNVGSALGKFFQKYRIIDTGGSDVYDGFYVDVYNAP